MADRRGGRRRAGRCGGRRCGGGRWGRLVPRRCGRSAPLPPAWSPSWSRDGRPASSACWPGCSPGCSAPLGTPSRGVDRTDGGHPHSAVPPSRSRAAAADPRDSSGRNGHTTRDPGYSAILMDRGRPKYLTSIETSSPNETSSSHIETTSMRPVVPLRLVAIANLLTQVLFAVAGVRRKSSRATELLSR
jgi:hypothetical protein